MSLEVLKDASDELISSLSYKDPRTASYIIDRKSSSFQAVGSNIYSPTTGVRLIRFNISSEDFLDPNSLRIQFDILNTDPDGVKYLYPVSGAHGFFSRARLLSRGVVVEDISQYNRVHEMFTLFKSSATAQNDLMESGLYEYNKASVSYALPFTGQQIKELHGIAGSGKYYRTVLFKPLFGLLNQKKYISLKYSPLTIELELDSEIGANIIIPSATSNFNTIYSEAATSTTFQIQNCMVRCDVVKIDSELMNKYDDHLLSNFINIRYTTYHSQILKILGASFNVNLSRALTYLTRVYCTFIKDPNTVVGEVAVGATANPKDFWMKTHNTFYNCLRSYNRTVANTTTNYVPEYHQDVDIIQSAQIQIGSKLIPEYPIQSSMEAFYFLKKALNLDTVMHDHVHALNIKGREYFDYKFVLVFDTELINGHVAAFTGRNVKNGEQITLKMQLPADSKNVNPEDVHIVLEAEQVLEIRGTYVRVGD